jgi:hypothetical protein
VIVTVWPVDAVATTADAFCFNARMPTSTMFFNVAHRRQGAAQIEITSNRSITSCKEPSDGS